MRSRQIVFPILYQGGSLNCIIPEAHFFPSHTKLRVGHQTKEMRTLCRKGVISELMYHLLLGFVGLHQTSNTLTRWTFFRVKLVFEFEFEISWSLGPWEPWTLEPLDLGTLGPLPSSNTSSYFPLHPLTSSYLFLLLSSFGMV